LLLLFKEEGAFKSALKSFPSAKPEIATSFCCKMLAHLRSKSFLAMTIRKIPCHCEAGKLLLCEAKPSLATWQS